VLDLDRRPAYARCGHLLPRIASTELDCVSDTLALLLAAREIDDVLTPFGCDWRFDLTASGGVVGPKLPPPDQDELLARRTGWRCVWTPVDPGCVADWRQALREGSAFAVVADAYHLPWVPYAGHTHMEHGFVVEGLDESTVDIVDPYDNVTEWGHATPQCLQTSLDVLEPALRDARWGLLRPAVGNDPVDPSVAIADNVRAIGSAAPRYSDFVGQYEARYEAQDGSLDAAALERLALHTWLLHRSRALHARWLASGPVTKIYPEAAGRFAPVVAAWQRASEAAYLALRRVRRGRAVPAGPVESLRHATETEMAVADVLVDVLVDPASDSAGESC
jgi:hypothetical protein